MLSSKSILFVFLLYSVGISAGVDNVTPSAQKETGSHTKSAVYTILGFIPFIMAGMIIADGNVVNEWGKVLVYGSIGGGLAYKGYNAAPDKNLYQKAVGGAFIIGMSPAIAQKYTEYSHK